ncbi:MAG: MerR family transcriptional regulator [Pseudobdellovibrionaceae bacterium]
MKIINSPFAPTRYVYPRKKTVFQKNTLKIGEVSKKTGVPIVTLRFYENHKLLKPAKNPDKKTRHRRYLPSVVAEVEFIKLCRAAGFTLPEIRSMLKLFRGFRPPAKILMSAIYRTLDRTRHQMAAIQEVERIMLLRMRDPQGDIETLIGEDEEILKLRGFKPKSK